MNWQTFIISVLGSGAITALVNGWMNNRTQIKTIKESGLYAKRADVLDNLMKKMEIMDRDMRLFVSPMQNDASEGAETTRRKVAFDSFTSFSEQYQVSRHYLPKKLSDGIAALCTEYRSLFLNFSYKVKYPGTSPNVELWSELADKIQVEFAVKKDSVADEFRKIIGVK